MRPFFNNRELYEYLVALAANLKNRRLEHLSEIVELASRHAAGMSTEFLGESRITLRRVLFEENGLLSPQERNDILEVLQQLDTALDRRGGTK